MAKKGPRRNVVNQGWQNSSQEIAPEPTPPAAIVLPEPSEAVAVLARLAEQNAKVTAARLRYEESAATTKQRKGKLEELSAELSSMLTAATSGSKTPLLDKAEEDLQRMEAAIAAGGSESAQEPTSDEGSDADTSDSLAPLAASGGSNVVPFQPGVADPPTSDLF